MAKTSIEWTDDTWNPVAGCDLVSPGCTNCYAMRMARRLEFMGQEKYRGLTREVNGRAVWTGKIVLDETKLREPLSWKKPRRVFVNSMSDLFHEDVPIDFIRRVFGIMDQCRRHTFQILTKRAYRMRKVVPQLAERFTARDGSGWPLPNVWLGVSIEGPDNYGRLEDLLRIPAAVRFVSYEPAIERVDFGLRNWADLQRDDCRLDWIIVGGESGAGARPFELNWARLVVEDARTAGVACFVKQLGAHAFDEAARGGPPGQAVRYEVKLRHPAGADPREWPAELRVRQFPGQPIPGRCFVCGCTELNPCDSGCGWVDRTQTLCSECEPRLRRKELKRV